MPPPFAVLARPLHLRNLPFEGSQPRLLVSRSIHNRPSPLSNSQSCSANRHFPIAQGAAETRKRPTPPRRFHVEISTTEILHFFKLRPRARGRGREVARRDRADRVQSHKASGRRAESSNNKNKRNVSDCCHWARCATARCPSSASFLLCDPRATCRYRNHTDGRGADKAPEPTVKLNSSEINHVCVCTRACACVRESPRAGGTRNAKDQGLGRR